MNQFRLDPVDDRGMEIRSEDTVIGALQRARFTTVSGNIRDHAVEMTMPLIYFGWRWRMAVNGKPTAEARRRLVGPAVTGLSLDLQGQSLKFERPNPEFEWRLWRGDDTVGWVTVALGWERGNRLSLVVELDPKLPPTLVPFLAYLGSRAFTDRTGVYGGRNSR